jgi:hypothetical protein
LGHFGNKKTTINSNYFFFPFLFCKLLPYGNQNKGAATHRKGVFEKKKGWGRDQQKLQYFEGGKKKMVRFKAKGSSILPKYIRVPKHFYFPL